MQNVMKKAFRKVFDFLIDLFSRNASRRVLKSALGRLLGASWAPLGASWSPKSPQRPPKGLPKASQRPPEGLLKGSQRHPKASKRLLRILSAFGDFLESLWRPLRNYANAFRCLPLRFNGYAVIPPNPRNESLIINA